MELHDISVPNRQRGFDSRRPLQGVSPERSGLYPRNEDGVLLERQQVRKICGTPVEPFSS